MPTDSYLAQRAFQIVNSLLPIFVRTISEGIPVGQPTIPRNRGKKPPKMEARIDPFRTTGRKSPENRSATRCGGCNSHLCSGSGSPFGSRRGSTGKTARLHPRSARPLNKPCSQNGTENRLSNQTQADLVLSLSQKPTNGALRKSLILVHRDLTIATFRKHVFMERGCFLLANATIRQIFLWLDRFISIHWNEVLGSDTHRGKPLPNSRAG
jgi:hypothetical protein